MKHIYRIQVKICEINEEKGIKEMSEKQYKVDSVSFDTVDEYCQKLMKIYRGE